MNKMNPRAHTEQIAEPLEQIASALRNGLVVVDHHGQIVWLDENTQRTVNGGLRQLSLPVTRDQRPAIDCFLSTIDVVINGEQRSLCVLQETSEIKDAGQDIIAAVEAVMSDTSWFTRTIVEKLKAWRQTKQPAARVSDLELLTDRERQILALICEGRSDADMSRLLGLSQNTVRNHVASLYRKIGVNRRSAAIIWARERAITSEEFTSAKARNRSSRHRSDHRHY
jgi:DNA-binding CsgD family transcriptional regulator